MTYYNELITEKSWKKLQELKRKYKFILIGGWAVYVYTKTLKSKDVVNENPKYEAITRENYMGFVA